MKICIDPGHGGKDSGAVDNGYFEKELNLKVSLELKKVLNANRIDVAMTREEDIDITDNERINISVNSGADICISIHFNSSSGKGKGVETIYQINNKESKSLAECVLDSISRLGIVKRRAYYKVSQKNSNLDYYFMLRETSPLTTIIVECLFMSNIEDIDFLNQENSMQKLANSISDGLFEYLEYETNKPHWSKLHFDKLKKKGIIEEEHNPNDIPTWAELAAIMSKTIEYLEKSKK